MKLPNNDFCNILFSKKTLFTLFLLLVICGYYLGIKLFFWNDVGLDATLNLQENAKESLQNLGVFGDFFNGVSAPLIGFVGIILAFFTIYAQSKNQLESTFVSVFNTMLNNYNLSQKEITYEKKKGALPICGKRVFEVLYIDIDSIYKKKEQTNKKSKNKPKTPEELAKESFEKLHEDRKYIYSQHFKILYNMLKYVDRKCSRKKDKFIYAGIIRSVMSKEEEKFLFYDALMFDNFKNLIEKYEMLRDLRDEKLIREEHRSIYKDSAYNVNI